MVAYVGPLQTSFDPKGQTLNKNVIKVTDITCGSPLFTLGCLFCVACSYSAKVKNIYLGLVDYIGLSQMPLDPEGQRSNIKYTKVTGILCQPSIFTPGTPCWLACSYSTKVKNNLLGMVTYCRVPARWGLRRTTMAPVSDETRTRETPHQCQAYSTYWRTKGSLARVLLWPGAKVVLRRSRLAGTRQDGDLHSQK